MSYKKKKATVPIGLWAGMIAVIALALGVSQVMPKSPADTTEGGQEVLGEMTTTGEYLDNFSKDDGNWIYWNKHRGNPNTAIYPSRASFHMGKMNIINYLPNTGNGLFASNYNLDITKPFAIEYDAAPSDFTRMVGIDLVNGGNEVPVKNMRGVALRYYPSENIVRIFKLGYWNAKNRTRALLYSESTVEVKNKTNMRFLVTKTGIKGTDTQVVKFFIREYENEECRYWNRGKNKEWNENALKVCQHNDQPKKCNSEDFCSKGHYKNRLLATFTDSTVTPLLSGTTWKINLTATSKPTTMIAKGSNLFPYYRTSEASFDNFAVYTTAEKLEDIAEENLSGSVPISYSYDKFIIKKTLKDGTIVDVDNEASLSASFKGKKYIYLDLAD